MPGNKSYAEISSKQGRGDSKKILQKILIKKIKSID